MRFRLPGHAPMLDEKPVILVADDDPAVRDALMFSLRLEGFEVGACRDGRELLSHPALMECDCILLDYRMPELSGLDVLRQLRARDVRAPVIFTTSPLTEGLRRHALVAGACRVLEKPLLDGVLTEQIRQLSAQGRVQ
jgi:two-component system response regulator MprA